MPDPVTPVSTTQPQTAQPAATPAVAPVGMPTVVQAAPSSSKGMMWVILAAFVVVAVLVGVGVYMYFQIKDTNPAFQQISQSAQSSLTNAANDLSGVKDEDVSQDFSQVDQDLKSL